MTSKKTLSTKNSFDFEYYEKGEELGISGYTNYRWMPERTIPFCHTIIQYLGIERNQKILDYGCAKGFMVKAFRMLGYDAWGQDISRYALENADPETKNYLYHVEDSKAFTTKFPYNWVVSKDVLEHVPYDQIDDVIEHISCEAPDVFMIVPLGRNGQYNILEYENDITHQIREPAAWWINLFDEHGFDIVKYSNRVKWMKDNWSCHENGNGFFTFKSRKHYE